MISDIIKDHIENRTGKSEAFDRIRVFYEKDKIDLHDLPHLPGDYCGKSATVDLRTKPTSKTGKIKKLKPKKHELQYKGDIYAWVDSKYHNNFKALVDGVVDGSNTEEDIKIYIQNCIDSHALVKVAEKNTKPNPLENKGKSYGKHVEQGWGQYVEPISGLDASDFDPFNI